LQIALQSDYINLYSQKAAYCPTFSLLVVLDLLNLANTMDIEKQLMVVLLGTSLTTKEVELLFFSNAYYFGFLLCELPVENHCQVFY
jgi:hypothetical protein